MLKRSRPYSRAFTIVELLIVIVVIAILAAITIVAYTGIQDRAESSAMQSNFSQAAKSLEAERAKDLSSLFPSTLPTSLSGYTYFAQNSRTTYCLQRIHKGVNYFITSAHTTPVVGTCEGLTGWWTFNGNGNDLSGYGNNGTYNSAVTSAAGQQGSANTAASFDGGSSRVTFTNATTDSSLKPTGAMSLSVWVRVANGSADYAFFSNDKFQCSPDPLYSGMVFISDSGSLATYLGSNGNCGGGARYNKATSIGLLQSDTWHHLATTVTDSRVITIYVDGVDVGGTYSGTATTTAYTSTPSLIGARHNGTNPMNGQLDDMRFYERALSTAEIQELFAAGAQ